MPRLVIDAAVILAWLRADLKLPHTGTAGEETGAAFMRELYHRPLPPDVDMTGSAAPADSDLCAPRLIHYEALEGFLALGLPSADAQAGLTMLFGLLAPIALLEPPYERAVRLTKRTSLPLSLCFYVALAEVEDCPLVVGSQDNARRLRQATSLDVRALADF